MFSSNLLVVGRASSGASSSRRAAALSSKMNGCTPLNTVSPKLANTAGVQRLASLVCEARKADSTPGAVEAAMNAVREVELPAAVRPALTAAVANLLMVAPAHAGVLFDFNLTMPIIMSQFLVLMVILDKIVFTPVGAVLDERDADLRQKVASVKGNSSEMDELAANSSAVVKEAILEIKAAQEAMELEKLKETSGLIGEARAKLDTTMAAAMADISANREAGIKGIATQVESLSDEIADRVLDDATSTADTPLVAA